MLVIFFSSNGELPSYCSEREWNSRPRRRRNRCVDSVCRGRVGTEGSTGIEILDRSEKSVQNVRYCPFMHGWHVFRFVFALGMFCTWLVISEPHINLASCASADKGVTTVQHVCEVSFDFPPVLFYAPRAESHSYACCLY